MKIELSEAASDLLMLSLGISIGSCLRGEQMILARDLIVLTNTIGSQRADFVPYEVDQP